MALAPPSVKKPGARGHAASPGNLATVLTRLADQP